jgi:hypothetical protein
MSSANRNLPNSACSNVSGTRDVVGPAGAESAISRAILENSAMASSTVNLVRMFVIGVTFLG